MNFKLSNRARVTDIEEEFKADFLFPALYRPATVISGQEEHVLPIITTERPKIIEPSIWGILPKNYTDDWTIFQQYMNTLHVSSKTIDSDIWYSDAFRQRRCLIIVTGFYTCYMMANELYPFCVTLRSRRPFGLAGIYNRSDDGLLTCSFLTRKVDNQLAKIHNLNNEMPIILSRNQSGQWMDNLLSISKIKELIEKPIDTEIRAYPVSKRILNAHHSLSNASFKLPLHTNNVSMPRALENLLRANKIIVGK